MSILTAQNLGKAFGADDIFENINVEIPHGARIALVGPNGAGKTTLLNIFVGLESPSEGQSVVAKNTRIGFLPQRPELAGDHSLWDEALSALEHLQRMESQLNELEQAMADPARHDTALAKYGPLQERFELAGGYTYESRLKMVLQGLGFAPEDFEMSLTQLSGGQKTRALLARLLLEEPDLLIMDEPTNHLDIQAVEWLEGYLKAFPGAILAVSHDRYFMDHFAQNIWELDYGSIETYRGNYSHYVQQREARRERLAKEYEAQQEFLAKEEAFIRKHMGSRLTAQAKGRMKRLETMRKRGKIIDKPRHKKRSLYLNMGRTMRSGDKVLMTERLSVGYPGKPLFDVPDITLYRGQVAALIGPNGVGKSTFLKTIIQQLDPLAGKVRIGDSVKIGYFAQAHERLTDDNSILDEIIATKHMPVSEARNLLGNYLFSGDDVYRPISSLSGGERGRVALAKLALGGANFLLLDEPTNHLDIDSQEVLQAVLDDFPGTILLVSHDRYLVNALASQIWAANPGELEVFEGSYAEYVGKRDNSFEPEPEAKNNKSNGRKVETSSSEKKHGLSPYELNKRVIALESQIHDLEVQVEKLSADIDSASAEGDADRVYALGIAYTRAESELEQALEEWSWLAE